MAETAMSGEPDSDPYRLVLPDFSGRCLTNLMPSILGHAPLLAGLEPLDEARTVVLLVIDGLGWLQLHERARLAPTLCSLPGEPLATVVPSTTATALTSLTTGLTPGQHGVVGYRIAVADQVLNVLRWSTAAGDARKTVPPREFQKASAFNGERPAVIGRAEFANSGFSQAHMDDVRFTGYRCSSTLLYELERAVQRSEPFVYVYYDGIDKVAHEYGLRGQYDAEVAYVDRLVADILGILPSDAVLVVTADHGQVHTGDDVVEIPPSVLEHVALQSGEARFRWLHARPGREQALLRVAEAVFADRAWVHTRDALVERGWFGPTLTPAAHGRLGDVALVAKGTAAFHDPADTGPFALVARHGSVTAAEMLVPLIVAAR